MTRRGAQAVAVPRHDRLVLGLRHLVFAQIKAFDERHVVLVLTISHPSRLARRTAHREGSRLHPEHFQVGRRGYGVNARKLETDTEANGVEAGTGRAVAALGGAQDRPGAAPGATAPGPARARCRSCGVGHRSRGVACVPIRRPLQNVPMHVVKAPWVGGVLPDVASLADSAARIIRI